MNESDLKAFLTLAETENSRDAAAMLRVNQSNVSRALARLEAELGAELFTRHGRRLELNRAGEAFQVDAVQIIEDFEAGRRRVRQLSGPQAPIRLGFLQSVARGVVPLLVTSFREVSPEARFELRQGFSRDLFAAINRDELDVVFATPPRPASGLAWLQLEEQRLCVAVPHGHRLSRRSRLSCTDLDGEDFIAFARPTELRQVIDPMLAESQVQLRVAFESREIDTITGLVGAGLGVAILPVTPGHTEPEVEFVPLVPATSRRLGLSWTDQRANPASVSEFLQRMAQLDLHAG